MERLEGWLEGTARRRPRVRRSPGGEGRSARSGSTFVLASTFQSSSTRPVRGPFDARSVGCPWFGSASIVSAHRLTPRYTVLRVTPVRGQQLIPQPGEICTCHQSVSPPQFAYVRPNCEIFTDWTHG
jgi:hypothetical protein